MQKERNNDPQFGRQPFKTIRKLELQINGMQKREDAAFLQYQLLTKPEILACHVEYANKTATVLFNPLDTDSEQIRQLVPAPFRTTKKNEKKLSYHKLLTGNFHL